MYIKILIGMISGYLGFLCGLFVCKRHVDKVHRETSELFDATRKDIQDIIDKTSVVKEK